MKKEITSDLCGAVGKRGGAHRPRKGAGMSLNMTEGDGRKVVR